MVSDIICLDRPLRIPMSAYVVEDMVELSQAHATYRFIVCDEEEEKPRLLVSPALVDLCVTDARSSFSFTFPLPILTLVHSASPRL